MRARDLPARCDLAIIGAGPAGMAAAIAAGRHGLVPLVLDENAAPGGQIYRAVTRPAVPGAKALGRDYWKGAALAAAFAASPAIHAAGASVWSLSAVAEGLEIGISLAGTARMIRAREVIIATGAMERPFPVPGWTLPGVMSAGAAQGLLKSSGLVPAGPAVLAGSGPLLYLLAAQLLAAGGRLDAILDTTPVGRIAGAWRHLPGFLASPYAAKGVRLLLAARRGTRLVQGVTALAAAGEARLERVCFTAGGREHDLAADLLLLHQGVVPNVNLAAAAGCRLVWDEAQACFRPATGPAGETEIPGLAIAGDGAGIGGAELAALAGEQAALAAAGRLGRVRPDALAAEMAGLAAAMRPWQRGRAFLDAVFRPADAFRVPPDDATIICRCEEVTAGMVRQAAQRGATGPNQMKAFLRCGMGPCQGRQCALTVTELIAEARGTTPEAVGALRLRPPVKPLTLGELASLPVIGDE